MESCAKRSVHFVVLGILFLCQTLFASPVISPERYNLKLLDTAPMLFEFHRLTTTSAKQEFHYPQRDSSWRRDAANREKDALLKFQSNRTFLATSLVGGIDFRGGKALGDTIWPGIDGGLYLRGYIDSLEFVLDARIYSERHYSKNPQSYDGEYIDLQLEEVNDGLEYVSYARYRGHLSLNMGFARFDVGRDVMHWGPGYYNNLALNQFSLPFNSMSLDLQVGPLTVLTIYGDLRVFKGNSNKGNKAARNLYGHRYELDFGNLVVGMSELQVVHDDNNAWLFVPIIPLFMEKGNYTESSNNGALSFDLNYRLFNKARFYTEFFMDDFQSPIELIKNENIQSKWAWMIGAQVAHDFDWKNHAFEVGTLFEYARVEPFVYTHFKSNTAQMAHLEVPLGNQGGPNSMTVDWLMYSRMDKRWVFGLHQKWFWKGTDTGSSINDPNPLNHAVVKKRFLHGAKMQYSITPILGIEGRYVNFDLEWTLLGDRKVYSRAGFKW